MADEAGNLSYRDLQHKFVSNLNGTSLFEISVVVSCAPMAVLLRTCVGGIVMGSMASHSWLSSSIILFLDYMTLVIPIILSFTVLADYASKMLVAMAVFIGSCMVLKSAVNYFEGNLSTKTLLHSRTNGRQPFICNFRAYVLIATAISILAVDFPIYPRRFAKAETYGTGIMDVGVGAFVVSNAIVAPEARNVSKKGTSFLKSFIKSLISSSPLLVLGLLRCLAVKSTDYQEHISEYGVHWNFFITLFIVRVLSTIIVYLITSPNAYGPTGLGLAIFYQYCLSKLGLEDFILHGSGGDGSRHGLVNANREGMVSCIGYLALYLMGLQLGRFLFIKRDTFSSWLKAFILLVLLDILFWVLTITCSNNVQPVSRRMANLTFVLWQMAYNIQLLSSFLLADLIVAVTMVTKSDNPKAAGCEVCYASTESLKRKPIRQTYCACLITAINRNQLAYFLLANLLTGAVNLSVKTLFCSQGQSLGIVCGYMFILNLVFSVLHIWNITLRIH
ncbi:phosphatidylinositol-glycan biosynthesis class W protein-like [Actinia tenebrosa]|uniref:Phosphatidylinositol-glycan biosynthesis class W protein n=1 Tax=Actinia tenebrosa TaxID=6105 RepID=A0A6P8HK27_ACTTE|nr:phosphatidylinositol-glycan biosynthesis class W protein-like [Actinia tenebrosa]